MATAKIAITIPSDILDLAKKQVEAGRAKSLSSFVSDAVADRLQCDELNDLLDAMDAEHGAPDKAARAWARRALRRSS